MNNNLEREKFIIEGTGIQDEELSIERKEALLQRAEKEAQERIRKELEKAKELLDDENFKKINMDILTPLALINLNELIKNNKNIFPKGIMLKAAKKFVEEDPIYNPEKSFEGIENAQRSNNPSEKVFDKLVYRPENFTPEEKQEFLESLIASHPNSLKMMIVEYPNYYYSEDFQASKEDETEAHLQI